MMHRLLPLATALLVGSVAQASPTPADATRAREILAHSISVPTVAGRGQVPVLAQWLAQQLRAGGFAQSDVEVLPLGETASLLARYPGKDRTLPALVLSVHMDVVEARPEDWERDPFTLTEANGFLYGRGTADDKFEMSMLIATLLTMHRDGFVPARDIVLAISGDEETGMKTTRVLAQRLKGSWLVINGDLGNNPLGPDGKPQAALLNSAEKTFATYELRVRNPGGHSSMPRADNAIYQLAAALGRLAQYAFPAELNETTRAYLKGIAPQAAPEYRAALERAAATADAEAIASISRRTEYNAIVRTTCVATMLAGGHAENALPQRASATVNCRILPGAAIATVTQQLRKVVADPGVEVIEPDDASASPVSPLRDEVLAAMRRAVDARFPGLPILPYMSAGGTDNKHFRAAGIDSYAVGSFYLKPEDDFSHGLDERVPADAIPPALEFWDTLLRALTTP